jgi:L-lactate dehydrogenase complex protein LldG
MPKETALKTNASAQAREVILSRIRMALLPQQSTPAQAEAAWSAIPRLYRRSTADPQSTLLDRLVERLRDYDAQVVCSSLAGVPQAIAQMLIARGADHILMPPGFPEASLPPGFTYVHDNQLPIAQLDGCAGVITTCTLAIAETGTIVLQNAPGQGRRAVSLVPDYHLCLIEAAQVVATVPEAVAALHATATLPTTFISGPSATADIEMTRIKGVHGPRFLDVILIV